MSKKPNKKKIRFTTRKFEDLIKMFFKNEQPQFVKDIVKEDNRYFLIDGKTKEVKESISRSVFSAGLFLGEIKKQLFYPSAILFDLLSKESKKKIFVDKKTEWLFLCGRDIFEKSIEKMNVEKGFVFVQNSKDENLGIGKFEGKAITNLFDKGDFLRREM